MTVEGDALYAISESVEAFAYSEEIPDSPPNGLPLLAIELNNSLVNEDYALSPMHMVKSRFTKRCKASNKSFLRKKKKPDDDRNAASRLGAASTSEVGPCVARPREEEKKEGHPEYSCTGVAT